MSRRVAIALVVVRSVVGAAVEVVGGRVDVGMNVVVGCRVVEATVDSGVVEVG